MPAVKFNYAMPVDTIADACASLKRRTAVLRGDIHMTAVSILHNWAEAGAANVARDQANMLMESIDENYRQACVNWFGAHAQFEYDTTEKAFSYSSTKTTLSAEEYQAAKAESMFDLTPAKEPQPYDLRAKVIALIEGADRKRKKGLSDTDNVPTEMVDGLRALVETDET